VQAVAAGQVLMTIADSGPMSGPLKAGKLRGLGVTAAKRTPAFPEVPTLQEAGIPDMEISLWTGIVAPIHTPPEVVKVLHSAIQQVLALADVQTAMTAIAVEPRSTTPDQYRDLIARDTARWKAVAATANIKLE
jgi:tripartite-type tricarboxylate transporter receptor subunit TctC